MDAGPTTPGSDGDLSESLEEALNALEHGLQSAVQAIDQIRRVLKPPEQAAMEVVQAPTLRIVPPTMGDATSEPEPAPAPEPPAIPPLRERDDDPYTPFERLWERMEHERLEKARQDAAGEPERHGLDLLPQIYMVTVEDREGRVDLVSLHRALLGIAGIDEISLASYANGVPVVSLRAKHAIDFEQLRSVIERTLRRSCELIPQDTGRIHLRLTSQDKIGV